ncbi:hypothetical protein [Rhodopseudomonas palustris]|uniref:Uncharacterized protein n=1 Tax=Rhodopseudomonas palustris (strain BisB18) TaxID=316056 RepID=Q21AM5_RHOPB
MAGIRVVQLQDLKPAPPLHRPWTKNRRVGDIVAPIDATLAQTQRVSFNPVIPAPITAATAPTRSAAFSSTDGAEALRLAVQTPNDSHRFDHAPELPTLFFLRRVLLERWKGNWLIGITWIGNDEMDLLVTNHKAIGSGDWAIFAMVSSDATGG